MAKVRNRRRWSYLFKRLGPGIITGASDDDPSGIATYSQTGAMFGLQFLWTAWFTLPLMISVQEMCGRIGLVCRKGLMAVIKTAYGKRVALIIMILCAPAILLNIGANIAGMGAVLRLLLPEASLSILILCITIVLLLSVALLNYNAIARVLKWLCMALFCYLLVPFFTKPDAVAVLKNTFLPEWNFGGKEFMMLTAILGTTISPYLFLRQTSSEKEENRNKPSRTKLHALIQIMRLDVALGMIFSNIVFYFIVLSTGTVLFQSGNDGINTVEEAAMALRPLAGDYAYLLFTIGVIGTGFLSVPVLAGSLGYMLAETFGWREGLNRTFKTAPGFYGVVAASMLIGLIIPLTGITPFRVLVITALLYGITAPIFIAYILRICNNRGIMGEFVNSRKSNIFGTITLLLMLICAGAYLFDLLIHVI
jgi:NRAMP (natural resistance-associated macrophage protein)-like metal ion transporter